MDIRHWFKASNSLDIKKKEKEEKEEGKKFDYIGNDIKWEKIELFTDGSTINNGKNNASGGIGVYFGKNDERNISKKVINSNKSVTNNICELLAIKLGIEKILETTSKENLKTTTIIIYSDSEYCINCITKWSKNWEKNGWKSSNGKPVKNKELIKYNYDYYNRYRIKFNHVRSHTKAPTEASKYKLWYGNEMADKLAKNASVSK
jgi:ribonuclease HI